MKVELTEVWNPGFSPVIDATVRPKCSDDAAGVGIPIGTKKLIISL